MVSTHCHFLQKAAWGRARASSYCTYSFFIVARYAIPVARYAIPVARDAISVSHEGGNLLLSGTVLIQYESKSYDSPHKFKYLNQMTTNHAYLPREWQSYMISDYYWFWKIIRNSSTRWDWDWGQERLAARWSWLQKVNEVVSMANLMSNLIT